MNGAHVKRAHAECWVPQQAVVHLPTRSTARVSGRPGSCAASQPTVSAMSGLQRTYESGRNDKLHVSHSRTMRGGGASPPSTHRQPAAKLVLRLLLDFQQSCRSSDKFGDAATFFGPAWRAEAPSARCTHGSPCNSLMQYQTGAASRQPLHHPVWCTPLAVRRMMKHASECEEVSCSSPLHAASTCIKWRNRSSVRWYITSVLHEQAAATLNLHMRIVSLPEEGKITSAGCAAVQRVTSGPCMVVIPCWRMRTEDQQKHTRSTHANQGCWWYGVADDHVELLLLSPPIWARQRRQYMKYSCQGGSACLASTLTGLAVTAGKHVQDCAISLCIVHHGGVSCSGKAQLVSSQGRLPHTPGPHDRRRHGRWAVLPCADSAAGAADLQLRWRAWQPPRRAQAWPQPAAAAVSVSICRCR